MEDIRLSSSPAANYRITKLFEDLRSLSQPRTARFTDFGRALWVVLISGWVVLAALSVYEMIQSKSFDLDSVFWNVIFPVVAGFALVAILRTECKHRKLLENGSLALGTIINQRTIRSRRGISSEITYSFKNTAGEQYQRTIQDHTRSYFPGMVVPVFYDPADPSRSVPICGTYLRVVDRDGQLSRQS